jgi:hypothetical protein
MVPWSRQGTVSTIAWMQNWNPRTGSPYDVRPDDARPPKRRRSLAAIFVWVVLVVGAIGSTSLIGYVAVTNPKLLGLGAEPTRRPTAVLSSPAPGASTRPTPLATPPATTTPGESDPVANFAAIAADPNASMHLESDSTITVDGERVTISMSLDQSGGDFAFDMHIRSRGRSVTVKAIVADGIAYARAPGASWKRAGSIASLHVPANSLGYSQLKANEAVFVRSAQRNGRELYLLRVPSTAALGSAEAELHRMGCDTDGTGMDLWVTADGAPVSGTFDFSCTYTSGAAEKKMTATATYAFSKIGQPIEIKPPSEFR